MKALVLIAALLAALFIARHWGDNAHNRLLVDAAVPTQSAPLMLPPQVCPSPWPIYPGAAKPRSIV